MLFNCAITWWLQRGLGCPGAATSSLASAYLMVRRIAAGVRLSKNRLDAGLSADTQRRHTSKVPHGACAAAVVQLVRHIAARTGHAGEDSQRRLSRPQRGPRQIRRRDPAVFQDYLVRLPSRCSTAVHCPFKIRSRRAQAIVM